MKQKEQKTWKWNKSSKKHENENHKKRGENGTSVPSSLLPRRPSQGLPSTSPRLPSPGHHIAVSVFVLTFLTNTDSDSEANPNKKCVLTNTDSDSEANPNDNLTSLEASPPLPSCPPALPRELPDSPPTLPGELLPREGLRLLHEGGNPRLSSKIEDILWQMWC